MNEIQENIDHLQPQMKAFFHGHSSPAYLKNTVTNEILETNSKFDKNPGLHHDLAEIVTTKAIEGFKGFISHRGIKYEIQSTVISPQLEMTTINHLSDIFENYLVEFIEKKDLNSVIEDLYIEKMNANVFAEELSQKLAESEMKFKKLARIAPIGIIYADEDFNIRWTNKQTAEIFAAPVKNGLSFIDLVSLVEIDAFQHKLERLVAGSEKVQFNFKVNISGRFKYVKCTGIAFMGMGEVPEGYVFTLADITENELYIKEITEKNLELNEVNLELDKFLYSVFHNIRGPIASLEGLLEVVKVSDPSSMNQLKHYLHSNLRLLNGFVSDIKSFAVNIHTNTGFEPIDLRRMIDQLINFNEEVHNVKAINRNKIPINYKLYGDTTRLNMALRNIVKNSFQYRHKDKEQLELQISARQKDNYHLIEIRDNGTGISEDVKPKVFDMFYRGSELSKGNGMGLYNANTIIKKLGGKIEIQSEENEFCNVRIFLPIIDPKE